MTGVRVHPNADGHLLLKEGEYGKGSDGVWYCRPPGNRMGNLSNHEVTEHEDGTITVSPSILISGPNLKSWHGYLEKGIWRQV